MPKDGTVWNIINEVNNDENNVSGADVQQIIYIALSDDNDITNKETSVHIVSQNAMVITITPIWVGDCLVKYFFSCQKLLRVKDNRFQRFSPVMGNFSL